MAGLRIESDRNGIAALREVRRRGYHTSFPTAGPQSVSAWRFCSVTRASISCRDFRGCPVARTIISPAVTRKSTSDPLETFAWEASGRSHNTWRGNAFRWDTGYQATATSRRMAESASSSLDGQWHPVRLLGNIRELTPPARRLEGGSRIWRKMVGGAGQCQS